MKPPPTRYKVVERGRRLEVIDTWSGEAVTSSVRLPLAGGDVGAPRDLSGPSPPAAGGREAKAAKAGSDANVVTTRAWYDDKAPRHIRMNYAGTARVKNLGYAIAVAVALLVALSFLFWPFAVILVFALVANSRLRDQLRAASTRWLDGFDQG